MIKRDKYRNVKHIYIRYAQNIQLSFSILACLGQSGYVLALKDFFKNSCKYDFIWRNLFFYRQILWKLKK